MKSQTFMEFEVRPQTSLEDAIRLSKRLDEARKLGFATEKDKVLTRVANWNDGYETGRIKIKTKPMLWPKASLSESEMFKGEPELFRDPPLSIVGQAYTGADPRKPEKHLMHVRSSKTFQGSETISATYAGYCEYMLDNKLMRPDEIAAKEFREEIKKFSDIKPVFVQDDGSGLILTERPTRTLDTPTHYMGPERLRNCLLSFVNYVDPSVEDAYPTVENLEQLNKVCKDIEDFEVLGVAWIPHKKLPDFWKEVRKADRVYSISNEISDNLRVYFDVLSK